jgi:hypothetical protein
MGVDGWGVVGWDARVPEYDAFGREIGADPLKAFTAPAAPRPARVAREREAEARPEAVVEERQPEPVAAPPVRIDLGRRRRRGGAARWIVLLAVLGAALVAVANVGVKVEGGIEDVVEGSGVESPGSGPTGLAKDSLLRERNFAEAIDTLSRAGLGRPITMRVAPDRIDATLVASGRLHQVQVRPGGELMELASGDAAPGRTIDYRKIDVSAPERLTRAGATKKVPPRRIDYLVLSPGAPVTWGAYYKGGRIVLGDAHGRKQRVL